MSTSIDIENAVQEWLSVNKSDSRLEEHITVLKDRTKAVTLDVHVYA